MSTKLKIVSSRLILALSKFYLTYMLHIVSENINFKFVLNLKNKNNQSYYQIFQI